MYKNITLILLMYTLNTHPSNEIYITFEQIENAELLSEKFCTNLIEENKINNPNFKIFIENNISIFNIFKTVAKITRKLILLIPGYAHDEGNRERLTSIRNELLRLTNNNEIQNQINILYNTILYTH